MTGHGDTGEDRELVFAAGPPRRGGAFATSRWGRAWVAALEDSALDATAVKGGRRLARAGAVGAVSVRAGRLTAVVTDRDGTGQRADVLLRVWDEEEWERLAHVVAGEAGHLAALLDGEVTPRLVEDAEAAGVELLPGVGDLEAQCGCGSWDHCAHTAALAYAAGRLVDAEPSLLLVLRGRTREGLLARLEALRAEEAAGPETVDAAEAYALGVLLPPPPAPADPPEGPGAAPVLPSGPGGAPDGEALRLLAADAAARAVRMLRGEVLPGLTEREDAVRLAAGGAPDGVVARLAAGSGRDGEAMRRAVAAWRAGGREALAVCEEEWTPEGDVLVRAEGRLRTELEEESEEDDGGPPPRREANRWTRAERGAQVRLGRDGRWWPYRREADGTWWPAGPGHGSPAAAWATAGEPGPQGRG